jgi:UDP-GlcNAc:undecaprenyl-phosphate/decaprenyl-phosphate GlcNAc-1-phosphate transferase
LDLNQTRMISYTEIAILTSFIVSFVITLTIIPTIVTVANLKKLYDEPGKRKAHKTNVPTLGGIAIFASLVIASGIFSVFEYQHEYQYFIVASVVLFLIGLKDDILIIAPLKKFLGQLFAAAIITVLGDVRLTSIHGFLGITTIPYVASVTLTIFVIILIINGFNLIDGIDGLASGVGILSIGVLGAYFCYNGEYDYALIALSMIGSLLAFFYFNVFGKEFKIFMGDTGSLLLGFTAAVLIVHFNEINAAHSVRWFIKAAPAVSFGILIVPLFDTLRVFVIRIASGKSPFLGDTNHVHHKLLALGYSHWRATLSILCVNAIIIVCAFVFRDLGIFRLMILNIALALFFSVLPEIIFFRVVKKIK